MHGCYVAVAVKRAGSACRAPFADLFRAVAAAACTEIDDRRMTSPHVSLL